jgi:hypothetical protein
MKTYFSKITADHWQAKNKLEEAAKTVASEFERKIIPESDIKNFLLDLHNRIAFINNKFSRCKPLRFSIEERTEGNGDYWIYCDGVFNMNLFLVK